MKKSLLALAVLGAFAASAQAQTNVSIGGVVQANAKAYKLSNTTRATETEFRIDDDYTSRFWLTGTEDLGGGLSALFYIENRFNTDQQGHNPAAPGSGGTGNGLGNGDTFLGLKGGFGQVTLGKHSMMSVQGLTTEILTGTGIVTAMPSSMFATFSILNQNAGYLDISRVSNSLMYRSPNISGFSASVGIAAAGVGSTAVEGTVDGTGTYNDGRTLYLQTGYANGPLSLNLAYQSSDAEGGASLKDQQLRFSGFYKFGPAKVGLQADRSERELASGLEASRTAWSIPVSFGFGNSTILASFTKAGDTSNVAGDNGAKMYTIGYDYALSKRTNVGVFYSRLDNDAAGFYQPFLAGTTLTGSAPAATGGETASTLALGVKHTF